MSQYNNYEEFEDSNQGDGIYQNNVSNEPIYGNIESDGAPKVSITPKFKPRPAQENVESRKKKRNRNPRNPTKSHIPDDMYSFNSEAQPGYSEPSSNRNELPQKNTKCQKRYIIIVVALISIGAGIVVAVTFGISKDKPGKQRIIINSSISPYFQL